MIFLMVLFSSVVFAQSYRTITIDGINDFTASEAFTNFSNADNGYFTWDADYIYFGIADAEADYGNMATFLYFDTDPEGTNGNTDAYAWTENIVTPFLSDYVIVFKNGSDYIEVRQYNNGTSNWDQIASENSNSLNTDDVNFGVVDGNDYREVRIKRSLIGSPSSIKVASFTEQQWSSNYRYFAWPSEDWTDGNRTAGQTIVHYHGFTLGDGYTPNHANFYDYVMRKNSAYISFDGTDDYVRYFDDATLQGMDAATDYTIEAWIYPKDGTVAEFDRVLQRFNSFNIQMYDGDNNGTVNDWYFEVTDGSNHFFNTESDATLTLDAWNHIAVVNNSVTNTLKLFVNGTDVTQTGGYTAQSLPSASLNDNLYIGSKKASTPNNSFGGYIDEVRLKNVAVDPADLHYHTTDNAYMSDANTAGLFHLDENTGTSTVNVPSGTNATLTNGPVWKTDVTTLPLPVELTSFTASSTGSATILSWETATEVNNYGFDVEASNDSENWNVIGFVDGHGNSNSVQNYSFVATDGAKYYRLKQIDTDGGFEYSDVVEVEGKLSYKLAQNHPNPFNPTTKISFSIPEAAKVSITVFNALGQKVAELANREFTVGNHSVDFDGSNLSSGIYFYRLNSANFSKTMKMMLLK